MAADRFKALGREIITCRRLHDIVGRQPLFLLDVREPYEFAEDHIEGAVNIPLDNLTERSVELPPEVPIICVCRSGDRSLRAARWLRQYGYEALSLDDGMLGWNGNGPAEDRSRRGG